jgi:23S rRNA (cytidine2498-2'-O)-methyltransferase
MTPTAKGLILLCRPGFENECAAEASIMTQHAGLSGFARAEAGSGFVHYIFHELVDWSLVSEATPFDHWVFARQRLIWVDRVSDLPQEDRATPLLEAIAALDMQIGRLWAEMADTNDAKSIAGFLKRFMPHIERGLHKRRILRGDKPDLPTLHLFFRDSSQIDICLTYPDSASPWPMGIARMRMPRNAPSRSTLKLAEAFECLMTADERKTSLRAGLRAVDLGAAPGGWSFQFAERGLLVSSVDNGPLADSLLATGMVEHIRADGFTWRPDRKFVEWMVCDMVEQPTRIAQLVADWTASGRCRRSIFNLKLPMKKRFEELKRCRQIIDSRFKQHGDHYVLRLRHLYHDREEITGYLARVTE